MSTFLIVIAGAAVGFWVITNDPIYLVVGALLMIAACIEEK